MSSHGFENREVLLKRYNEIPLDHPFRRQMNFETLYRITQYKMDETGSKNNETRGCFRDSLSISNCQI